MIAWMAAWGTGSSIHDTEEQAMEAAARGQRVAEIDAALERDAGTCAVTPPAPPLSEVRVEHRH